MPELSAQCTAWKTGELNGCLLLYMFVANYFRWYVDFLVLHSVFTEVVFRGWRVNISKLCSVILCKISMCSFHIRLFFLWLNFLLFLCKCDVELDMLYFVCMNRVIVSSISDLMVGCVFHSEVRINTSACWMRRVLHV